ncbi:hypothetical protein HNQ69_000053 [Bartonella callosciuri]|uniref:Uncharacterized protein n=1 Tax=Bartonella callosciuri TaxID=686223 RepID=A0A840NUJ8_9HYPH|nr:hypothetical protein [Bartonella callosciuri]
MISLYNDLDVKSVYKGTEVGALPLSGGEIQE